MKSLLSPLGETFVALTPTLFPYDLFLTLLVHHNYHMHFSRYHRVIPKFGLNNEHYDTLLHGNDCTTSDKNHIFRVIES